MSHPAVSIHAVLLAVTMVLIVLLATSVAVLVNHRLETLGAPQALGGFLVAVLVLSAAPTSLIYKCYILLF